jgi:hypothetical protein
MKLSSKCFLCEPSLGSIFNQVYCFPTPLKASFCEKQCSKLISLLDESEQELRVELAAVVDAGHKLVVTTYDLEGSRMFLT